jgi:hypothetical protein
MQGGESRFLENYVSTDVIDHVVISAVDAHTYVVLSEVERHVPYGELVGTRECLTLYPRCRTNRGHYKRV